MYDGGGRCGAARSLLLPARLPACLPQEVRKLRNALSARTDEVFSLENRSSQLEMTVDARKRELEAARAVQRASVKLLEEERHRLAVDVRREGREDVEPQGHTPSSPLPLPPPLVSPPLAPSPCS